MGMSILKLLKYVLFFFNFLFWLCGCCILSFGIYLLVHNNFGVLFHNHPSLTLGNVLIIVGSIIMVVAFLGCMGSIKENKCLLMSFFALLLIILLAEVTLAILLFLFEKQLGNYVYQGLNDSFQRYEKDNKTKAAWDSIQTFLQCCGVNGTSDWNMRPPPSCPSDLQVEGCYLKAETWFHSNFLYIGIITICVCVIQVLGMSFALTLNCQIDKTSQALGL
ncbi:PREDICTED: leukocyte surface antigen CD53 [Condylura cristata]|uniref:leukocyte surface antigen CD53 n=1 Tax=Condylura cristata TaxID=143302 RepID=UPI0003344406|nr:PREDICTED: leukocyte surface antigen CD53 [Condylura cristata]